MTNVSYVKNSEKNAKRINVLKAFEEQLYLDKKRMEVSLKSKKTE